MYSQPKRRQPLPDCTKCPGKLLGLLPGDTVNKSALHKNVVIGVKTLPLQTPPLWPVNLSQMKRLEHRKAQGQAGLRGQHTIAHTDLCDKHHWTHGGLLRTCKFQSHFLVRGDEQIGIYVLTSVAKEKYGHKFVCKVTPNDVCISGPVKRTRKYF
jgi:hypothetical protein